MSNDLYDLPPHPYAERFPIQMEGIEELAEDINANSQRLPIIILDGQILDGRRRMAACKLAKVEPWTRNYVAERDGHPWLLVLSLNSHRRNLKGDDDCHSVVDQTLELWPEKSDREIARMTMTTHPLVGRRRAKLVAENIIPNIKERVDAAGRSFTTKPKPTDELPPKDEDRVERRSTPEEKTEDDGEQAQTIDRRTKPAPASEEAMLVVDRMGKPVPVALCDAFTDTFYDDALEFLKDAEKRVKGDQILYARLHHKGGFFAALESMKQCLANNSPHCPCVNCNGGGCDQCYATGFLSAEQYKNRVWEK